jgi:hypothetical protein
MLIMYKVLCIFNSIPYNISSLKCLYILDLTLVRSKLKYVSTVWNSITTTHANELERIERKFMPVANIFS